MRIALPAAIGLVFLTVPPASRAGTYLITPSGSGDFPTIQAALNEVVDGDTVALADGTFVGAGNRNLDYLGKAITLHSQGGQSEFCILDCQLAGRGLHFHTGEGSESVLDGITVKNAAPPLFLSGGAIYCVASSPRITNCTIKDSRGAMFGGGILCEASSAPQISGCSFEGNSADWGGAVSCHGSSPIFVDCDFVGNHGLWQGGAMYFDHSSPSIQDSRLVENDADPSFDGYGGAIGCDWSTLTIVNCVIERNWAHAAPAVLCNTQSHMVVRGTKISGNWDDGYFSYGGAIACSGNSTAEIHYSLITGNQGGGIHCDSHSYVAVARSTIAGNNAGRGGGLVASVASTFALEKSILWGNCAHIAGSQLYLMSQSCEVSFACCCVDSSGIDGITGYAPPIWLDTNVFLAPQFCAPEDCSSAPSSGGHYKLWNYSPCNQASCGLIGSQPVGCWNPQMVDPSVRGGGQTRAMSLNGGEPNPFVSSTRITFRVPEEGGLLPIRLGIHDASGRLVGVLYDGLTQGGTHTVRWSGRDARGVTVPGGVYFSKLQCDGETLVKRLILIR